MDMTCRRRILTLLLAVGAGVMLGLPNISLAQPSADQLLTDMGLASDDKQRVLSGEFVTAKIGSVSERDLAFAIAFLVKAAPDALSKQIVAGELITADAQVQAHGEFTGAGSLANLAGLQVTSDEVKALSNAKAGDALNLSTSEIAAFKAVQAGNPPAIQQQLQRMLLARYQAYRTSGLAGIAAYDRGGQSTDAAADLRRASQAAKGLEKYMPAFHAVLLGYPQATVPGMKENFFWMKSNIEGKPTYVLTHILAVSDGVARAIVRRQYYVSTGYNGEQSVAGFLPVQGGTVVVTTSHAFTDQVAGFGGSMKRNIGSSMMASKMKQIYDTGRKQVDR
jgi:hypothetical protein